MKSILRSQYRSLLRWTQHSTVRQIPFGFKLRNDLSEESVKFLESQLKNCSKNTTGLLDIELLGSQEIRQLVVWLFHSTKHNISGGITEDNAVDSSVVQGIFSILHDLDEFQSSKLEAILERRKSFEQAITDNDGISPVPFTVGQVVMHKKFKYRGVVYGWDVRPVIDVSKWDGVQGLF